MLKRMMLVLTMLVWLVAGVHAQESPLPIAVTWNNSLWLMTNVPHTADELPDSLKLLTDVHSYTYYNYQAAWSPDGTKLAYLQQVDSPEGFYEDHLQVWDGSRSFEVANLSSIAYDTVISWTNDGRIAYERVEGDDTAGYSYTVYAVAPEANAVPEVVATKLPKEEDCGIGTADYREGLAWSEMGTWRSAPMLAVTDYGIIYPTSCTGGAPGLFKPETGEVVDLGISGGVLSPDGAHLAGIQYDDAGNSHVVTIDLATLKSTTTPTPEPASIVAWGSAGDLYYATEVQTHTLFDDMTPEQIAEISRVAGFDISPDMVGARIIRIYHHAADGTDTLVHEQDAYAVTRLALKGDTLVFSIVPNGDELMQAMLDGTLTAGDMLGSGYYAYLPVTVNFLSLNADGTGGEVVTLPGNLERIAVAP